MTVKVAVINPKRDGILAGLLIFAVAAAASLAVYIASEIAMKAEIRENLKGLAQAAANMVDVKAHLTLDTPEEKNNETYRKVQAPFRAMINGDENLAYIYTVVQKDEKIYFVIDSQADSQKQPTSGVMDEYKQAPPTLEQAFADKTTATEAKPYTDETGTFLSGYAPFYDDDHNFIGMAGVDINVKAYNARMGEVSMALWIGLLIAVLCSTGCGFGVYRLRRAMQRADVRAREQQDELAAMEARRVEAQQASDHQAAQARRQAMHDLAESFENSVQGVLRDVVSAAALLQGESEKVSVIAVDTKDRSQAVSRISNDAAQTSSQVAAASEELTASIREIRDQTEKSNQIVRSAADKGAQAKDVIERLSKSSGRIGEVVNVINDIAGQINLLALNATIESARAGEAGKGFAVVANEVKNLSGQVSRALGEISTQIHDIQSETQQSVVAMGDILGIINDVTESTVVVATAVSQQSEVTREISQNIHATAHGAREIADTMVSVLASADETGVTAERVRAATARLQTQSQTLNTQVDAFLRQVRA